MIDPNTLTLGEVRELMVAFNAESMQDVFDAFQAEEVTVRKLDMMAHLVWFSERRGNPAATLEDAYSMSLTDFTALAGSSPEEAEAEAEPSELPTSPPEAAEAGTTVVAATPAPPVQEVSPLPEFTPGTEPEQMAGT